MSRKNILAIQSFGLLFPFLVHAQEFLGQPFAFFSNKTVLLSWLVILLVGLVYFLISYLQFSRLKLIILDILLIVALPLILLPSITYLFLFPDFFTSLYRVFYQNLFYVHYNFPIILAYLLIYGSIFLFFWKLGKSEIFIHVLLTTVLAFSFPLGYYAVAEKILNSSGCNYNLFLKQSERELHASNCVYQHIREVPYSEIFKVCKNVEGISQEKCNGVINHRVEDEAIQNNRNPALCAEITDIQRRDFCYLDASAGTKDATFCNQISRNNEYAEILIPECIYRATPTEKLIIKICDAIPLNESNTRGINQIKDGCYADLAKSTQDATFCDKVSKSDQYYCREAVRKLKSK